MSHIPAAAALLGYVITTNSPACHMVCRKEMGMSEALPFSTTGGHENQGTDMNDGEPTVRYLGSFQASQ